MKPFWHKLQDRIFKPGYDQEAYMELVLPIVSFQTFDSEIGSKVNGPIRGMSVYIWPFLGFV